MAAMTGHPTWGYGQPGHEDDGPYRGWGYCAKCERLTPGWQHRHGGGMGWSRPLVSQPVEPVSSLEATLVARSSGLTRTTL